MALRNVSYYCLQIGLYEDKMKKLHEEMVNIQVENSTLQSQSSSLLSQINQLQITQGTLETSKRKVILKKNVCMPLEIISTAGCN